MKSASIDLTLVDTASEIVSETTNESLENQVAHDLIEFNLSLTPEERLINHQRALDTINELLKARKQVYGESDKSSETPA